VVARRRRFAENGFGQIGVGSHSLRAQGKMIDRPGVESWNYVPAGVQRRHPCQRTVLYGMSAITEYECGCGTEEEEERRSE
jgi:hypothetical protein